MEALPLRMETLFYFMITLNAGLEIFFFLNERIYEKRNLPDIIAGLESAAPPAYDWSKELAYKKAHGQFSLLTTLLESVVLISLFTTSIIPSLFRQISVAAPSLFLEGIYFGAAATTALAVFRFPLSWYVTFVIEERFGFNRKDGRTFLKDQGISFSIGLILSSLTLGVVNFLVSLPYGVLLIFLFLALLGITVSFLFPLVILPLFYRITPIEEGPLKAGIHELIAKTGLKVKGIFSADQSRRSAHANAMVAGLGSSKKVILFDTLFEKMQHEQILSVLAHELAHWGKGHILKLLTAGLVEQGSLLLIFWILWSGNPGQVLFGVGETHLLRLLIIIYIVSSFMSIVISPLHSWLSRKYEFEADEMAGIWTSPSAFSRALSDLATNDLSWIPPSPLQSLWFSSHPSVPERILRLSQKMPSEGSGDI